MRTNLWEEVKILQPCLFKGKVLVGIYNQQNLENVMNNRCEIGVERIVFGNILNNMKHM